MSRPKKVMAKTGKPASNQLPKVEVAKAAASNDRVVFTAEDKELLEKQESVIASNIGAFLVLGEALYVIKEHDLQKVSDSKLTFDEYCSRKWGFGQAYAYRLISCYKCVKHLRDQLAPNGVILYPANEAQVRPLTSLSPEDQVKAWISALKRANGGVITAAIVESVADGMGAQKASKLDIAELIKNADAKAEHKKLKTIANIVAKVRQTNPAVLNVKVLLGIISKIEKTLKS